MLEVPFPANTAEMLRRPGSIILHVFNWLFPKLEREKIRTTVKGTESDCFSFVNSRSLSLHSLRNPIDFFLVLRILAYSTREEIPVCLSLLVSVCGWKQLSSVQTPERTEQDPVHLS